MSVEAFMISKDSAPNRTRILRDQRITTGQIRADRERLTARGHVGPVEATVMRRGELPALIAVVAVSLASVSYTVGLLTKSEDVLAPALNMVMVLLCGERLSPAARYLDTAVT